MPQFFSFEIPREVVHDDLPDEAFGAAVVAEAASRNVGREQHVLHVPQRTVRRKRFGLEHIECGAAKVAVRCSSQDRGPAVKKVCTAGCIGCGICAKQCEQGAVTLENNLSRVDPEKCVGCGKCVEKCPTKSIRFL